MSAIVNAARAERAALLEDKLALDPDGCYRVPA